MIRFAIIGLGERAREAVLPAFARVPGAQLAALVSPHRSELRELGRRYRVPHLFPLREIDNCLLGGYVDAVYIGLPPDQHCAYAVQAANAYKHVLCEPPLALTAEDAESVAAVARRRHVKLMTADPLQVEPGQAAALALVRAGKLGDLRAVCAVSGPPLRRGKSAGAGPASVTALGAPCVHAARRFFGGTPADVFAMQAGDESLTALLRYPDGRAATFTASRSLAGASRLDVYGTKGRVALAPAGPSPGTTRQEVTIGARTAARTFRGDPVVELLRHFADCILHDREPMAGAVEAIADLRLMEALQKSARLNRAVKLAPR